MAAEETRAGTERSFREYGHLITNVMEFKHLGCIITAKYYDWTEVVANLRKARKKWARMLSILGQKGANERTSGKIYKAVVQAALVGHNDRQTRGTFTAITDACGRMCTDKKTHIRKIRDAHGSTSKDARGSIFTDVSTKRMGVHRSMCLEISTKITGVHGGMCTDSYT